MKPLWTLVAWLAVVVVPVVFLGFVVGQIVSEDESRRTAAVRGELLAEMRGLLDEIRPERRLQQQLDLVERNVGFRLPHHELAFASGTPSPYTPRSIFSALKPALRLAIPAPPLLIVAFGADGREVAVEADPRFFTGNSRPAESAARFLVAYWARTLARRPWQFAEYLEAQRRRWAPAPRVGTGESGKKRAGGPASDDWAELGGFAQKIGQSLFGDDAPSRLSRYEPTRFFSKRYGTGNLYLAMRVVTVGDRADAPLLGGFIVAWRQADLGRSFLFDPRALGRHVLSRRLSGVAPGFHRLSNRLCFAVPMPVRYRTSAELQRPRGPRPRVPSLVASRPQSTCEHPLRRYSPWAMLLLVVWVAVMTVIVQRGAHGHLALSMPIAAKLRWALVGALLLPALALAAFLSSYLDFIARQMHTDEALRRASWFERLEGRISLQKEDLMRRLWEGKERLMTLLDGPEEHVGAFLDRVCRRESADNLQLVLADGREWLFAHPARGAPNVDRSLLRKLIDCGRVYAARQFLDAHATKKAGTKSPAPPTSRSGRRGGRFWRLDRTALARALDSVDIAAYAGEAPTIINAGFSGLIDRPVIQLRLMSRVASGPRALVGVMFVARRPEVAVESCVRDQFAGRDEIARDVAVFRLVDDVLAPRPIFSGTNAAARPAGFFDVVRTSLGTVGGTQTVESNGRVFVVHRFGESQLVAAAAVPSLEGFAAHWLLGSALGGAVYLTALLWLMVRFLARTFLQPMGELVDASRAVARGEYAAKVRVAGGGEFAALGAEFNRMCRGLREGRLLARFVSHDAADDIRRIAHGAVDPGGEQAEVAVLFSHIADFSALATTLGAAPSIALLNSYFTAMETPILAHDGAIDKYIGDAIMAVFRRRLEPAAAPEVRALKAALAMREALRGFNETREFRGLAPLRTGIGVAAGTAISGRIGSRLHRLDHTVIGDIVNLAARLESMRDRAAPDAILLDAATAAAGHALGALRDLGPVAIKGKIQAVPVFELRGRPAS